MTKYSESRDDIFIDWFLAPKNGTVCLKALFRQLMIEYPYNIKVLLEVPAASHFDNSGKKARFNLYFSMGFKIESISDNDIYTMTRKLFDKPL
jgi:hypothetical protein